MAGIVWTLLFLLSLSLSHHASREKTREIARAEASMALQKDILYRLWGARHGGVYVPVSEHTPPNPNLAHIPERDLTTPSGRRLTLVNPAYMTRQVFQMGREFKGPQGHITSLKPLWEGNAPDDWERQALLAFEKGEKEIAGTTTIDGKPFFRLIRPYLTDQACLKCHAQQGYKLGDVRGGITVSIPMTELIAAEVKERRNTWGGLGLFWLLGLMMIGFGGRQLHRDAKSLFASQVQLAEQNEELAMSEEELRQQMDEYLRSQDELLAEKSKLDGVMASLEQLNRDLDKRVAERTAQLAAANESLAQEVAQRSQAEEEAKCLNADLLRQKSALEAVNRELESFGFSVSHDLRAPLRHLDGFSQALFEECQDSLSPLGKDYLLRIRRASKRMEELIDALLNLSRLSSSEIRWQRVPLSEIARELIQELQESDPHRDVAVSIEEGIVADGDPLLLKDMMANLIGNAWKYTGKKPGARICFGSSVKDGKDVFYVRDNGAGFDMAYADKLFGVFQRLHSSDDYAGHGIGLATVQRIINLHGGKVWAEGTVGLGATFFFTLS